MPLVVQKFGGTSVNTPEKRQYVLEKIISAKEQGYDVVVVVSAMGRRGEPYATDTLLGLLEEISPCPDPPKKDLIASCGEVIATCIVAQALEEAGYSACAMTGFQGGIRTDRCFCNAQIQEITPDKIREVLQQGRLAVIAGFQGWTSAGEITTLGRGGSDTTALALGGALGAERVEIYTDVPGIALADPRLIPEAPYLKSIDFLPMYILARAGAKIVHARAVQTAMHYQRPFVVRSTFTNDPGTLVGEQGESVGGLYGLALTKDIFLVTIKNKETAAQWRNKAFDDLFFEENSAGCTFVVQNTAHLDWEGCQYSVSPGHLLTVLWNPQVTACLGQIEKLFAQERIAAHRFVWPGGASWVLSQEDATKMMKLIFQHFSQQGLN